MINNTEMEKRNMNTLFDLREEELLTTNGGDLGLIFGVIGVAIAFYEAVKTEVREKAEEDALVDLGLMSK